MNRYSKAAGANPQCLAFSLANSMSNLHHSSVRSAECYGLGQACLTGLLVLAVHILGGLSHCSDRGVKVHAMSRRDLITCDGVCGPGFDINEIRSRGMMSIPQQLRTMRGAIARPKVDRCDGLRILGPVSREEEPLIGFTELAEVSRARSE